LLHALLISWFSSLGQHEIPSLFGLLWDKLLHGASFALLTFLLLLALNRGFARQARPVSMVLAFLISLLYGVFDELHQATVATRVASAADLLADGIGSLAAIPCYAWIAGRRRSRIVS
jgi:VanZ family protein